ncbi:PREDICTED: At4g18490 [Prunus dulcis]|uniref:PREDICTED: At4g18490 n=1 Tax=Prunus dulcis TaxID=3755 RepID=A0A5E4G8K8_PRUDU|nr:PREDICTED: At4g18490 [Prunus dulcis]
MAESKKATSSSVNPKEKSSLLDEEIGNEFLSSWKSMSVMEDDGMDFSFDTVSKGKKKVFDFEKLDMDFNLDGDFNKLSSFKMDMPDLDFSSPPKKSAKTERSEEEPSRGNRQGKQDRFKFSFDFNELDNFDFDSSLKKSENSCNKNRDSSKEVVSDRIGSQNSKIDLAEEISTLDGDSERVATSKVDTTLLASGNGNSMNDDCASKSETSENLELPYGPMSPEKVMTKRVEESDQEIHLSEKAMPTEPYANQATHDLPHQLVGGDDSNGDTFFEGKNDITTVNTFSSGKEDVNEKMPTRDGPDHEDLPLKDSSPMNIAGSGSNNSGRSKSGSDILTENFEPAIDDSDLEDNSNTLVSKETPHNIKSMKEDQNSTGKLPLSMQGSESAVDEVTLTNKIKTRHFHSNVSKRLEEAGSQLCQPSLKGAKSLSSGIKRIGSMHLHPAIEQGVGGIANDAQIGSKLIAAPVLVDRETKVKHVIPGREDFNSAGVLNKAKLVGSSLLCNKEVTEREPVLGSGQRKSLNDLRHAEISSSQASPSSSSEKTSEPSAQTCVNSKFMLSSLESMRNTKIITAEGNKLFTDKTAKKKTELSTLNISKNIGGKKVSFNAASQKEVKSLSSEKHMEVQGNVELKTAKIVDRSEKQMPPNLSLKRKTFEGSDSGLASLKPLKRLSHSPSEIRNVTEPSKRVVEEQVYIHESHLETKTKSTLDDHPTSGLGSPCSNAMELEIHSIMENDGNVEKAEAYTKELEDICNMLKKKHEEAKELLVRAVDHVALSLLLFGLQGPDTPSNPAMPTLLKTQMSCFIVESGVALATSHLHVNFQTLKIIGGENNDDGDVND